MAKGHIGCPRCGSFLKANSNLREKLKEARLLVEKRDAEVKSLQNLLGEKMSCVEELRREVSQERAAHEQTRSVYKSAEKEVKRLRKLLEEVRDYGVETTQAYELQIETLHKEIGKLKAK